MSKEGQPCPTCGKVFKRLASHKCKVAGAGQVTNTTSSSPGQDLQQCPTLSLSQTFKRLSIHKCKAVPQVAPSAFTWSGASEMSEGALQTCPGCGQKFKRLAQHRCQGRDTQSAKWDDGSSTRSIESSGTLQICPGCEQQFKRLAQHRCKGWQDSPSRTRSDEPTYRRQTQSAKLDNGSGATRSIKSSDTLLVSCKGPNLNPSPKNCLSSAVVTGHHPISRSPSTISSTTSAATSYLDDEAFLLMQKLGISPSSDPRHDTLQFFEDDCKLMHEEKQKAQEAFNRLRTIMIEELEERTKWQWEPFNSGSSYDGTKVTRPDEVDCMFVPAIPGECFKIKLEGAPPGFCFVEFHPQAAPVSDTDSTSSSFLEAQQAALDGLCEREPGSRAKLVRSDSFREMTHGIFKIAVGRERKAKEDPHYKPGSPAYPIILKLPGKPAISIDSVPALRVAGLPPGTKKVVRNLPDEDAKVVQKNGCHVTPKQCKIGTFEKVKHLLWRISFSSAEKQLTKYADQRTKGPNREQPTCRKEVLRILKRLLEVFKGFDNSKRGLKNHTMLDLKRAAEQLRKTRKVLIETFTTFEIRNFMLWEFYENCPGADKWTMENRRARLQHALIHLKKMITGQSTVPHFFLRTAIPNIMQDVPTEERDFLYIMFTIAEKLF